MTKARTFSLALIASLAACGPVHKPPAQAGGDQADSSGVTYDRSRCSENTARVVRLTTRADGKPDIWKFYATTIENATKIEVLVCKQVDLNHDSKVDIVTYYDQSGRVAKEEIDLDFDGKFDETVYYEAGKIARKEYDRNHDGKADSWAYFENDKLARIERDSKYRGRIDCWEYYESGKLDRIGWDTTGTGRVDIAGTERPTSRRKTSRRRAPSPPRYSRARSSRPPRGSAPPARLRLLGGRLHRRGLGRLGGFRPGRRRLGGRPRSRGALPRRSGQPDRPALEVGGELGPVVRGHAPARLLPLRLVEHHEAHRVRDEPALDRPHVPEIAVLAGVGDHVDRARSSRRRTR